MKVLGFGMDRDGDGQRISQSRFFRLLGGSEASHEVMLQLMLRIEGMLRERGRDLKDVDETEFRALLAKIESSWEHDADSEDGDA